MGLGAGEGPGEYPKEHVVRHILACIRPAQRVSAHPARCLPIASDKFTCLRDYDERRSTAMPRWSRQNCRYYVLWRRRIDSREQVERVRRASQQPTLISTTTTTRPVYLALRQPARPLESRCLYGAYMSTVAGRPASAAPGKGNFAVPVTRFDARQLRADTHTYLTRSSVCGEQPSEGTYCARIPRDRIQGLHCRAIEIVTAA
jgi:hypothetical protein